MRVAWMCLNEQLCLSKYSFVLFNRNEAGNGRRGNARKRKNRAGHTGPFEKVS